MKLHPKELFQKKESNVLSSQQQTTKQDLLQFFCDSLKVYDTLETIIRKVEILSSLQNHGLERQEALKQDIEWLLGNDKSLTVPVCGQAGLDYSNYLEGLITPKQNIPKFICNFYNFYFAHTAGGVVVGKGLSKRLLNDAPLEFYQWKSGNMQELKKEFCEKIDSIAEKWTADEKKDCLGECLTTFRFAGSLLKYVTVPPDFGG
jgi:heme oxygenase